MNIFLKNNFLFFIIFITGAAVLIIQITAIRILSPHFGNTIFNTSSVIGVILGALSLGYYFGGIISDRNPRYDIFFFIIFLAGIFSFLIYFFSKLLLFNFAFIPSLIWGPLISSFLFFFIPNMLLGMISPFAIKLKTSEIEKVGSVSGKVYFWSTLGSIFGSFFAGFYLIPRFGTSKIIIAVSLVLIFLGIIGYLFFKKVKSLFFLFSAFIFFIAWYGIFNYALNLFFRHSFFLEQKDGLYGPIFIQEQNINGKNIRFLRFDNIFVQSGIFLDSDELVSEYTKYYRLYQIFNPKAKKALFIGGGAYTTPRRLLLDKSEFELVDVVEIEPLLYKIAKDYFRLPDDPRLRNHNVDGRRFLFKSRDFYDLIFLDAFSFGIPDHFATKEFFVLVKPRLSEKGVFLMNVVGSKKEGADSLLLAITKTFCSVFEYCYLVAVASPEIDSIQNFILFGGNEKLDFERIASFGKDDILGNLKEKMIDISKLNLNSVPILTDDFAPVEYFTAKMVQLAKF